jgi:ketosteroid isomerase-like protein
MKQLLSSVVILGLCICSAAAFAEWNDADRKAVQEAAAAYAAAWLSNDADSVMATFVAEPVLSPSGLQYREGQAAARQFWFSENSLPTKVTGFELQELEIDGSGDLGFVRGTFTLAFDYDGESHVNRGKYISLLRRQPDGNWLITHHIWDDFPQAD